MPIYAAIIAFNGTIGQGLLRGVLGAAVMTIVLGRPYGALLNWIRHLFGLPSGVETHVTEHLSMALDIVLALRRDFIVL